MDGLRVALKRGLLVVTHDSPLYTVPQKAVLGEPYLCDVMRKENSAQGMTAFLIAYPMLPAKYYGRMALPGNSSVAEGEIMSIYCRLSAVVVFSAIGINDGAPDYLLGFSIANAAAIAIVETTGDASWLRDLYGGVFPAQCPISLSAAVDSTKRFSEQGPLVTIDEMHSRILPLMECASHMVRLRLKRAVRPCDSYDLSWPNSHARRSDG